MDPVVGPVERYMEELSSLILMLMSLAFNLHSSTALACRSCFLPVFDLQNQIRFQISEIIQYLPANTIRVCSSFIRKASTMFRSFSIWSLLDIFASKNKPTNRTMRANNSILYPHSSGIKESLLHPSAFQLIT